MNNFIKSVLIIFLMIVLQLIVHILMVKPIITTWGASDSELNLPMIGDKLAPSIISTRAISINASKAEVWKWVNQLGADRAGFFSYTFLEKVLGYEAIPFDPTTNEFKPLIVGDIILGSIDRDKSVIIFEFPVLDVVPEDSFVLEDWGTFKVVPVSESQSRLIVRTQSFDQSNQNFNLADLIGMPDHYIMERRMLLGIKEKAEGKENKYLSPIADILWFFGIVFSFFGICFLIFKLKGAQSIIIPSGLGILWLFALFVINPIPQYGLGLFCFVIIVFLKFHFWKKEEKMH